MQVTESGRLVHLYWGEKVALPEDLPTMEEITGKFGMYLRQNLDSEQKQMDMIERLLDDVAIGKDNKN